MPTPADTSCHERCGLACQAAGVAAVTAAFAVNFIPKKYEQLLHMFPDPNQAAFPCGVFWINDQEQVKDYSTHRDLIGFPVHWAIMDRKIEGRGKLPRELLKLREITVDALRNLPLDLTLVPETHLVEWVPEKVIDERFENLPAFKSIFSAMTFICWCKRVRGLKS